MEVPQKYITLPAHVDDWIVFGLNFVGLKSFVLNAVIIYAMLKTPRLRAKSGYNFIFTMLLFDLIFAVMLPSLKMASTKCDSVQHLEIFLPPVQNERTTRKLLALLFASLCVPHDHQPPSPPLY